MTAKAKRKSSDIAAFRASQAKRDLRPYESLMAEDRLGRSTAERNMDEGWKLAGHPLIDLSSPIDWNAADENRIWAFHLHSWDPLGPILRLYDETGEPRLLEFTHSVVADWIGQHPDTDTGETLAWYDMAVGLRSYRLAYVLDAVTRSKDYDDDAVGLMLEAVALHVRELGDDEKFQDHNNHGFFQAAGQLALASRLPDLEGMDAAGRQARERLLGLIETQFSEEGIHLEHSPAYHLDVLTAFERILAAGLELGDSIGSRRERLEDAFAWLILPNRTLPMIGDTTPKLRPPAPIEELASSHLRHVLSDGEQGELPEERLRAFPESGYVAMRARIAEADDSLAATSYLLQTCAFHSRTHKHADDLSFVWYDRGTELLVDSGRYGYLGKTEPSSELYEQGFWYSDPKRIYVESTAAHNTVEIDGASHQRKGIRPYGSALARWGENGDVLFAESIVRHRKSILHSRVLILMPGEWLVVFDGVIDTAGGAHDYVQRFHFGPSLEAEQVGDGLSLIVPDQAAPLYMLPMLEAEPLEPVRGQEDPLLGWISPRNTVLEPVWTGGFAARQTAGHVFATLFAFGDVKPRIDRDSRSNVSGRKGRLMWEVDGRRHQIDIDREGDDLSVIHKTRQAKSQVGG